VVDSMRMDNKRQGDRKHRGFW